MNYPVYKLRDWVKKEKLNTYKLSENCNAISYLKRYPNQISYYYLSRNMNAIDLITQNPNEIDWDIISYKFNAMDLLERNLDKINWNNLSANPYTIELLKNNQDKINWNNLSTNPSIFTLDYEQMRINNQQLEEDLLKAVLHPRRVIRNIELYGYDVDDMFY